MRRVNDFYPTPKEATVALFRASDGAHISGSVLEPCVGAGDMFNVILEHGVGPAISNDIDPQWPADFHVDAITAELPEADWVITNPPFTVGLEILNAVFPKARKGVAFLLRVTFNEPTIERGPWLRNNPPHKVIHMPRVSFTGDGRTDSAHAAWLIWYKDGYQPVKPHDYVTKEEMRGYCK